MEWAGAALLVAGTVLITLGTIGLFRFPDALTRLHALTKADNVGLGLCVLGLALIGPATTVNAIMVIIWIGVSISGATAANLIARRHLERTSER